MEIRPPADMKSGTTQARDVCEEAFEAVTTVRDFSLVFDAYAKSASAADRDQ